jgi:plasmid maintenance system antidote protein VapI
MIERSFMQQRFLAVSSGNASAAEAARLFEVHRSSVSRLISQANF